METICVKCGRAFRYKPMRKPRVHGGEAAPHYRKICDECVEAKRRAVNVNIERDLDQPGLAHMTREEVARREGMSERQMGNLERRALRKIRNDGAAREIFRRWVEEGCPVAAPPSDGEQLRSRMQKLLDWHLGLWELWAAYERVLEIGSEDDARKCLRQIERFYRRVSKAIDDPKIGKEFL